MSHHHIYMYCKHCGHRYVPQSMVMLLLAVYREYDRWYRDGHGLVNRKDFQNHLRQIGPLDDEQVGRVFGFLREIGFISPSADKKYLIEGAGEEAQKNHELILSRLTGDEKKIIGPKND